MARRGYVVVGVVLACSACNSAPPVPDNPLPPGAPDFGSTRIQDVSPPPISGATLLVSHDGKTAIAADPDRDFVSFVDLSAGTVRARTDLSPRDEPSRLVEDAGGLVHVVLRGTGELATLSLATGNLVGRRPVCAQPRGVAYDGTTDQIVVACATGELVTFPAASGPAAQTVTVEPDLRDVVIDGDSIFVSKYRTAEVLRLTRSGEIGQRTSLPTPSSGGSAALAWRMRGAWDHQLIVAYQVDSVSFVPTTVGGYGGSGPASIVQTAVVSLSTLDMTTKLAAMPAEAIVLPVDLALPPIGATGITAVVVAAGNWKSTVTTPYARFAFGGADVSSQHAPVDGQLIATEIAPDGSILLQSREPARLYVVRSGGQGRGDELLSTITLSDISREDTGHTIFHTNSGGSLACASCHGEGGDDAQTWNFNGSKPRRTPSLLGTVKGTAPYHWDADFPDLQALLHEVYTRRMSGRLLAHDQVSALRGWLEPLPAPKRRPVDSAAKSRGESLFHGKAACDGCHSGPSYTNNATTNVGTGVSLQVPPLVGVGARPPFLHDGCAKTLTERFTRCASSAHGQTSALSGDEINDLVTFLDSL